MEPKGKNIDRYNVDIIIEALKILEMVLNSNDDMTLRSISALLKYSKNKTFRILKTLEYCGVIEINKSGKYSAGALTYGTALKILSKESKITIYRQAMSNLAKSLNESVYITKKYGSRQVLVDMVDCTQIIKSVSLLGTALSETKNDVTVTETEIGDGLTHRIAVSCGSIDPDVTTVSMSICNNIDMVFGSLVVVAPTYRMSVQRIAEEVIPRMHNVASMFIGLNVLNEKNNHIQHVMRGLPKIHSNAADIHRLQHHNYCSNASS